MPQEARAEPAGDPHENDLLQVGDAVIYCGSFPRYRGMLFQVLTADRIGAPPRCKLGYWDDPDRETVLRRVRSTSVVRVDPETVREAVCDVHGVWFHLPDVPSRCPQCEAGLCRHGWNPARCNACTSPVVLSADAEAFIPNPRVAT